VSKGEATDGVRDHSDSVTLRNDDGRLDGPLPRILTRLARLPAGAVAVGGLVCLAVAVLLDGAARHADLRLVPLYVPILCVTCWALKRGPAILFAIIAAIVALLPDILIASNPSSMATAANALLRAATYIFLALIITAYRRAFDEADHRAMHDGLTGVLNKIPFETAAARHLTAARRARQTLLVACVDLDGFKAINTIHGHKAGDSALRSFAREALNAIRGSDLVGRLGGDEFGFLLSAPSGHNSEGLVHALHQRLTTMLAKTGLPLSCSMGALIVSPRTTLSEADLFNRADRLMRKAKADGKGRVLTEPVEG
jgi:diguanylate cyclase (GGDEF)-like protein